MSTLVTYFSAEGTTAKGAKEFAEIKYRGHPQVDSRSPHEICRQILIKRILMHESDEQLALPVILPIEKMRHV